VNSIKAREVILAQIDQRAEARIRSYKEIEDMLKDPNATMLDLSFLRGRLLELRKESEADTKIYQTMRRG
jgi:hypothetical protein